MHHIPDNQDNQLSTSPVTSDVRSSYKDFETPAETIMRLNKGIESLQNELEYMQLLLSDLPASLQRCLPDQPDDTDISSNQADEFYQNFKYSN